MLKDDSIFTPPTVQNGGRGAEGHQRYRLMRKGGIYEKQNSHSPLSELRTDGFVFGRSARQADCDGPRGGRKLSRQGDALRQMQNHACGD